MQIISYKILFEVRVLHDYYLMNSSGQSFYDLDVAAQRVLLLRKLRSRQYDIMRDLDLLISPSDKNILENHHMKIVKTPTGFYVGAEVKPPVTIAGAERFSLRIKPREETVLTFGLAASSSFFSSITNLVPKKSNSLIYYFTNKGVHTGSALSAPVEPLGTSTTYQMGDLALLGKVIHQALEENSGDRSKWEPIAGSAFVHQADRRLSIDEDWYSDWLKAFKPYPPNPLAVLQIAFRTEDPTMELIDADGFLINNSPPKLTHPVFDLRFLSRPTYWRYQKQDGFTAEEVLRINTNASAILEFKKGKFISKKPQRLSLNRVPMGTTSFRLPNALPGVFKSENGRLFSDIYFNINTPIP